MSSKKLSIKTEGFTESQIRLIKSLHSLIENVLFTKEEDDYFDSSAEIIRICASLIKQAQFIKELEVKSEIPYSQQVLEYSIDLLEESINNSDIIRYDH